MLLLAAASVLALGGLASAAPLGATVELRGGVVMP